MCSLRIYYTVTTVLFFVVVVALVTALMKETPFTPSFEPAHSSVIGNRAAAPPAAEPTTLITTKSTASITTGSTGKTAPATTIQTTLVTTTSKSATTPPSTPPTKASTISSKAGTTLLPTKLITTSTMTTTATKTTKTRPPGLLSTTSSSSWSAATTITTSRPLTTTTTTKTGSSSTASSTQKATTSSSMTPTEKTSTATNRPATITGSSILTTRRTQPFTTSGAVTRTAGTTPTVSVSTKQATTKPFTGATAANKAAFMGGGSSLVGSFSVTEPMTTTPASLTDKANDGHDKNKVGHVTSIEFGNNMTTMLTEEGVIKNWLFSRYGLHVTDRPVYRYDDSVAVSLKFELLRFLNIDDLQGSMAVLGIVVLTWENPFLAWKGTNLTPSRIHRIQMKSNEVWTPGILHLNNVKELNIIDKYGRGRGNMVMELFENGTQLWPPTGIYESSCDLNFTFFPLDTQTCAFVFESWLAESLVNISSAWALVHDNRTFVSTSQIWEFRGLSASTQQILYDGTPYSQAWVVISMRRRHAYYTWNILIPCASLSLLQLSTFALPPETPERASFSVTVLVAFGILQTIIKAEIPTTSDTVLLVLYVVGQLSIGTLATFYVVISVGLASPYQQYSSVGSSSQYLPAGNSSKPINKRRQRRDEENNINASTKKAGYQMNAMRASGGNSRHEPGSEELLGELLPLPPGSSEVVRNQHHHHHSRDKTSDDDNDGDGGNDSSSSSTGRTCKRQNTFNRYLRRFREMVFFRRPILNPRTIRIMDATAFTCLAVSTFIGHLCVYALLSSADDDH